ncbi:MAG TPA: hypothetical protein VF316_22575 [Polyangiaceae bacterium]
MLTHQVPRATSTLRASELRTLLAFAEAILPGSSRTPGADESTVARVDQLAGELLPQGRAWF